MSEATASAIFAPPGHARAARLLALAEAIRPGTMRGYAFPVAAGDAVGLGREAVYWNGDDVSRLGRAALFGFAYHNPVVPQTPVETDWSLWQYDYISEQQKTSFLYSAFSEISRRGVRLYNPPSVYLDCATKPDLLLSAQAAGAQIPALICTNSRDEAEAFAAEHEIVLWRPATGRAAWQVCGERQREALFATDQPPVLLAAVVPGLFLRCYLCDGEPVLALRFGAPAQTPLERLEFFQLEPDTVFYPALREIAANSGLRWGVIHAAVEGERVTVYDIDPDPVTSALPEAVNTYLLKVLACHLMAEPAPLPAVLGEDALVRELPFLRRMLSVLFDIERSKYAPAVAAS
ncbi:hypothetical protein Q4485_11095 [Granulosicoccaceae sp. 1_MG-2023]|nr:hypothetical protein [Granulosicoccaceae sp. 1_MG-2023]